MGLPVSSLQVASHEPRLRRVLSRTLGRDEDAADLLHDVYVEALEGMARLRDPQALAAWLSQIAVNVARAHIRSRMRDRAARQVFVSRGEPVQHDPFETGPAQLPLAVRQLLSKLPVKERAATALRFVADYELNEVAAVCQVSIPTVERRLASARRRLRRHV